ncbi:hypothetical protein BT96DRAFT_925681 [Gymnopus androsaceus JB14]|uniref:Actin-like ATPase domain-containing protein n=1 Tax=Gymnopus androsaceus JB14 TaxID=1447944 RepID=A0A6A4H0P3_9AGAR|nr:hypothetical protein BT96DRAFT_925681 [Gymnopus androsaceus JB14]
MQLPTITRKPYDGNSRKLVIAFDIGTTFSGVSYSILDPGAVPVIHGVTSFPAQENVGGSAKIPSIIYYDKEGQVRAVGSEATEPAFIVQAEDEEFIKVEWFKLHLRPETMKLDFDLDPLPSNKTPVMVFSDFLRYLFECTKAYIQEDTLGKERWPSVQNNIDFILAHPNGWEIVQQAQMRNAAVQAGLVSESESRARVHFVTEGEASLHFCINKKVPFKPDEGVIIVDAGGGTVDTSAYRQSPLGSFEEIVASRCIGQGSAFVGRRAYRYLQEKLKGSRFEEEALNIASEFDAKAKLIFRSAADPVYIKFGTTRVRDLSLDIKGGQLKLVGEVVKSFFEPSIKAVVQAVKEQQKESAIQIKAVFLVGGYSASPWLFLNLHDELTPLGLTVSRPDAHLNKAVADGALSYYLDHFVSVRVPRVTYGTDCATTYDPTNIEHLRRRHLLVTQPTGRQAIPNTFSTILAKGTQVHEEKEFYQEFFRESSIRSSFTSVASDIMAYRGKYTDPRWLDIEPQMFTTLCTIFADVSDAVQLAGMVNGRFYYRAEFKIVLLFGGTETKALISWLDDGKEKRSPATIVFDQTNQLTR